MLEFLHDTELFWCFNETAGVNLASLDSSRTVINAALLSVNETLIKIRLTWGKSSTRLEKKIRKNTIVDTEVEGAKPPDWRYTF
jgi:hypothetical protein